MNIPSHPSSRFQNESDSATRIIHDAIRLIKKEQRPCGNFLSLSSSSLEDFSGATSHSTTFFTSNILHCLCSIIASPLPGFLSQEARTDVEAIAKRAAHFLLLERNERWSFNYFAREENERKNGAAHYPDDLDDTFAALIALRRYQPSLIYADVLAAITKLLISCEVREGGPYRTWIVPPDTAGISNDADVAINGTVGYFLSMLGVHPSRIGEYLTAAVRDRRLASPYYPGPCQAAYFASRYYGTDRNLSPAARNAFISMIREIGTEDLDPLTPLESAMLISSYFNCGLPENIPPPIVHKLIDAHGTHGWRPYPFCVDPAKDHKTFYAGSSALTAAFIAEALAFFISSGTNSFHHPSDSVVLGGISDDSFHRTIQNVAIQECKPLTETLRTIVAKKIMAYSDPTITAPSHDLKKILGQKGCVISSMFMEDAALAGFYGWMAYDIYDDLQDREGCPILIPVANFFLRMLIRTCTRAAALFPAFMLGEFFNATLDTIDSAGAWEISHCNIPSPGRFLLPPMADLPAFGDYSNLANRSIGYAMGPLAELRVAGFDPDSAGYRNIESFFRHYLIARQLNDDAHDWEEDLRRGRINPASALLIKKYCERFPGCSPIDLNSSFPHLREFFWREIIDDIASLIHAHVQASRRARDASNIIGGTGFMENALNRLEAGAAKAVTERNGVLKFLANF